MRSARKGDMLDLIALVLLVATLFTIALVLRLKGRRVGADYFYGDETCEFESKEEMRLK